MTQKWIFSAISLILLDRAALLGYRVFYFHKLIRKRNLKAFKAKLKVWYADIKEGRLDTAKLTRKIKGWIEYARYANSYKLRKALLYKGFSQ